MALQYEPLFTISVTFFLSLFLFVLPIFDKPGPHCNVEEDGTGSVQSHQRHYRPTSEPAGTGRRA